MMRKRRQNSSGLEIFWKLKFVVAIFIRHLPFVSYCNSSKDNKIGAQASQKTSFQDKPKAGGTVQKALHQDVLRWLTRLAALGSAFAALHTRFRALFTQEGLHRMVLTLRSYELPSYLFAFYYDVAQTVF